MSTATPTKRKGRSKDTTPNKTFPDKKLRDNDDGTATYLHQYNDENGNRITEEITKTPGKRGRGRTNVPNRVMTPKQTREGDDLVIEFPYTDSEANRHSYTVRLSVNNDELVLTEI